MRNTEKATKTPTAVPPASLLRPKIMSINIQSRKTAGKSILFLFLFVCVQNK